MSNARSPRDVCSTTIGTSAISVFNSDFSTVYVKGERGGYNSLILWQWPNRSPILPLFTRKARPHSSLWGRLRTLKFNLRFRLGVLFLTCGGFRLGLGFLRLFLCRICRRPLFSRGSRARVFPFPVRYLCLSN